MGFLLRLFFTWLAIILASHLFSGIEVSDYITALMAAAVLTLLNSFVKPILVILTIPITLITLGLFLLVINAIIVMACAWLVKGFTVDGFWWALLLSFFVSLVVTLLSSLDKKARRR